MQEFYNHKKNPAHIERAFDNIGYLIKLLNESMTNSIEQYMQEFELTASQWHPIVLIGLGKADTPAEIARLVDVDTGAMTRTLDRLEKKGFIYRERSKTDRRVIHIKLTPKGYRVTDKLMPAVAEVLNQSLKGFSNEEFILFRSLLLRLLNNINPKKVNQIRHMDE